MTTSTAKRRNAAFLACALATTASNAGVPRRIYGDHWYGCTDRDQFDRISAYIADGDFDAFKSAMTESLTSGECAAFKDGETVYVTDTKILSGMVRIRLKQQTKEFWTNMEAVQQP